MRRLAVVIVLFGTFLVSACSSTDTNKFIRIGQSQMRAHATQPGVRNNLFRSVTWDEGERVIGELDDAAFPGWARGSYVACVRWEETFYREVANPEIEPGGPARIRQAGLAKGWILVGEGTRYHVLELTVTFDGQTFEWIRAWDPP